MFTPLIIECLDAWYHADEEDLLKLKREAFNEPRNLNITLECFLPLHSKNVAIYLTKRLRGDGLGEICKELHMKSYSSAGSAIERVRAQISKAGDPENVLKN